MTLSSFPFQAIIFDMDGLLVDSEPIWEIAENRMLAPRGKILSPELRKQLVGTRMDVFLGTLREKLEIEDSIVVLHAEIVGHMVELIPVEVKPKPGAAELVAWVAEQRIPCAIASSSPYVIIDTVVKHYGWQDIFATRVSAAEVPHGKPAPDVYLEAARRLGVSPAHCLALEDSPNGARAAVAAGMTCYAIPDPAHASPQDFRGITGHTFDSLHHVLKQLAV
jgi:HAD superfamily hydrolase (TIGR01509 family)